MNHRKVLLVTILSLYLNNSLAKAIKTNARPVHEYINEKSRSDRENGRIPTLPYANPLAPNSKQSAKQHALTQQAMFNAEKIRQHRAQLQRWTSAPQQMDSYMKAYHESQENHHLALEKQQAIPHETFKSKDQFIPITTTPTNLPKQKQLKRIVKSEGRRVKQERPRNHRSYGSVDYYSSPKKYQTIYMNAVPNYEGVTIKPNGNIGIAEAYAEAAQRAEISQLYTKTIPSKTQYVYPKQYSQMQAYQSAQDIASLNSLLEKAPNDQLSELNALIHSSKQEGNEQGSQEVSPLHQPIDLYFYMKDHSSETQSEDEQSKYAQLQHSYAQAYAPDYSEIPTKDHTPITEEVDDIANPDKPSTVNAYGYQTVLSPQTQPETTTVKSNNYYKVEVASQTISSGYKPIYHSEDKQPVEYTLQHQTEEENKPTYQTVQYAENHPNYYLKQEENHSDDESERYLHHNAKHHGVQHLIEDGSGVSAYAEESHNVSNNSKANKLAVRKRRTLNNLDTNPFLLPDYNKTKNIDNNSEELSHDLGIHNNTATSEALVRLNHFSPQFNPGFPLDPTEDYDEYDEDNFGPQFNSNFNPNPINQYESIYEDEDYNQEEFPTDYGFKQPSLFPTNHYGTYAPSVSYSNQNVDLQGSFSNKHKYHKRRPSFSYQYNNYAPSIPYTPPSVSYTPTAYGIPTSSFGVSHGSSLQSHGGPLKIGGHNFHSLLEPVYMLTESQLKQIINHHNLNIGHSDVFQMKRNRKPFNYQYGRKYRKRYPHSRNRSRKVHKKLHKLNKILQ